MENSEKMSSNKANRSQVLKLERGASRHNLDTTDAQLFADDEIFRITKNGKVKFGVVLETLETNSGLDDEDEVEHTLNKGEARVSFYPEGRRVVYKESAIGLVDRSFMLGDVVRRLVKGKDTQRGYCQDLKICLDVRICGTKNVIRNVSSDRLGELTDIFLDSVVCMDSWVGSVKEVEERATLRSTTGVRFDMDSIEFANFKDNRTGRGNVFSNHFFYPGNTVIGRPVLMSSVKLLPPHKPVPFDIKGKPLKAQYTVESLFTDSIWVHWQCRALSTNDQPKEPKNYFKGEEIKQVTRLKLFDVDMIRINDLFYLDIKDTDEIIKKAKWDRDQATKYKKVFEEQKKENDKCLYECVADLMPKTKKKEFNSRSKPIVQPKVGAKVRRTSTTKDSEVDDASDDESETESEDEQNRMNWTDEASGNSATVNMPNSSERRKQLKRRLKLKTPKTTKTPKTYQLPTSENKALLEKKDKVVVETLLVYTTATVIWQDGTKETDIPSYELYPIHQLDNHEFFPGDYVISAKDSTDVTFRDYGVVQQVDHFGRTARVKWFTTYTSEENPNPAYNGETEESVYDLKDHPDFQYRPGTIVIRIANFIGEDATCTAGQIINNCLDGRLNVKWVDGHTSMSWPQDIFEVGDIDQQDYSEESDDSWETESEDSVFGEEIDQKECEALSLENIERARVSIGRLEEIFHLNPHLQSVDVMKKLIGVYKTCRHLDRMLDTTFFHENNFMGLIERVRKSGCQTACERALERKIRLFGDKHSNMYGNQAAHLEQASTQTPEFQEYEVQSSLVKDNKVLRPTVIVKVSSTPFKNESSNNSNAILANNEMNPPKLSKEKTNLDDTEESTNEPNLDNAVSNAHVNEKNNLLSYALWNIEKAYEETCKLKLISNPIPSMDDSGNFSRNDGSSTSDASSSDLTNGEANTSITKANDDPHSISNYSIIEVTEDSAQECIRLCSLLKEQLHKCVLEIRERFFKNDFNCYQLEQIPELNDEPIYEYVKDELRKKELLNSTEENNSTTLIEDISTFEMESFKMCSNAPKTHKFYLTVFNPVNSQIYFKSIQREHRMLKNSLPSGVYIRVFEDRLDLLSVMIEGPKNTPYEHGLFFFDFQLGRDYPRSPPLCHYISYCSDRLNPNLYEDGKVCVSLLGTWTGRNTEVWGPKSTLLQVIVSIQGLILVNEPYYNEAGYEKHKETQQGMENSRMYNEMVTIKLVQAISKLLTQPLELYRAEVLEYYRTNGYALYERIKGYIELSNEITNAAISQPEENDNQNADGTESMKMIDMIDVQSKYQFPDFPIIPASKGFCLAVTGWLENFKVQLDNLYGENASKEKENNMITEEEN